MERVGYKEKAVFNPQGVYSFGSLDRVDLLFVISLSFLTNTVGIKWTVLVTTGLLLTVRVGPATARVQSESFTSGGNNNPLFFLTKKTRPPTAITLPSPYNVGNSDESGEK